MIEEEATYEVYTNPSSQPTHGALGLPIGQNRRITAQPPPTIIVINDDDDGSYTGSPDGINDNENIISLTPTLENSPIDEGENKSATTVEKGEQFLTCGTS